VPRHSHRGARPASCAETLPMNAPSDKAGRIHLAAIRAALGEVLCRSVSAIVGGDQVEQVHCDVELGRHFPARPFGRYAACLAESAEICRSAYSLGGQRSLRWCLISGGHCTMASRSSSITSLTLAAFFLTYAGHHRAPIGLGSCPKCGRFMHANTSHESIRSTSVLEKSILRNSSRTTAR
jgi:hypothetical protein